MLRVGLFGVGDLGRQHIENWRRIDGVEVAGFYTPDKSDEFGTTIGSMIAHYENAVDLIEASDIVDIILAPEYHFSLCKEAISRSKHVFVEKIIADNMEEASIILKLVKEANIKFKVSQPERFNPAYIAAKQHIAQPRYIEAHRQTKPNATASIDKIVLDLMIYDIDIILSLMENNVRSVSANAVYMGGSMPDVVNARIQFDNGSIANITSSRVSLDPKRKMIIYQNESFIEMDLLHETAKLFQLDPAGRQYATYRNRIDAPNILPIDIAMPSSPYSNHIEAEMSTFIASIRQNSPILVDELAGYRAMEVAYKIIEQIKKHKFI